MSTERPFDLGKLDFEGIRRRRRRKLLLFSLPVCFVIVMIALKLLSLPILSQIAHSYYMNGRYDIAHGVLKPLGLANWFESYKQPFNQGNALYKKGDFVGAEAHYRTALVTVPEEKECDVRINLALAIEAQADEFLGKKNFDKAIIRYDDVKAVLQDGKDACGVQFSDDKDGGATSERIEKRVTEKSDSAKRQRNNDEATTGEGAEGEASDTHSTKDKLEELEKKSTDAQKERAQRQQTQRQSGEWEKSDRSYDDKNW